METKNSYKKFEEEVYNFLLQKHKDNPSFTFSIRRIGTKGAETDYFIGTKKSNYFATTFWYIPVAYAGNANELISVHFRIKDNAYNYKFEFLQTKDPQNNQNNNGLILLRNLKPIIKYNFSSILEAGETTKMERYWFNSPKPTYKSVNELLEDFEKDLEKLLPLVDKEINNIIAEDGTFNAGRYTEEHFNVMLNDMELRKDKYENKDETKLIAEEEFENGSVLGNDDFLEAIHPLNLILYGPPGTGKTFHTINKAVAIIDGIMEENINDYYDSRGSLKSKFDDLLIEDWESSIGQIAFITFHQSMSYEDFIEGIKPMKSNGIEPLSFDIEDGIFKKICKKATSNYESSLKENKSKLTFEEAFEKLKENWETYPLMKFPLKTKDYDFTIIGFTNTSIQFKKASGGTSHTLSINTLKELYYGKNYDFKQGVGIYYPGVLKELYSYNPEKGIKNDLVNYVLIIDEINRGNISQIFGELITLIEDDKRLGKEECIEAILPYSKEKFTIPPNLYIIGTMNTADRSVEALDTALRRRFVFQEMIPNPELLSPVNIWKRLYYKYLDVPGTEEKYKLKVKELNILLGFNGEVNLINLISNESAEENLSVYSEPNTGIDFQKLLTVINNRLNVLLSNDNAIGHAWLMNVYSLSDLQLAFKNKIYPLLQEYFYNNYAKIGLVLGDKFVSQKSEKKIFASFQDGGNISGDYEGNIIYTLIDPKKLTIEDFKSIYQ